MTRVHSGLLILALSGLLAGHAAAQSAVVKERQGLMKGNGKSMKVVVPMVKGEAPYDAAKAKTAMDDVHSVPPKFAKLFPEGSDIDPKTAAKPEIWENWSDFEARLKDMEAKSAAAAKATAGGLDSFKPALGQLAEVCKGCHEKYKVKQD